MAALARRWLVRGAERVTAVRRWLWRLGKFSRHGAGLRAGVVAAGGWLHVAHQQKCSWWLRPVTGVLVTANLEWSPSNGGAEAFFIMKRAAEPAPQKPKRLLLGVGEKENWSLTPIIYRSGRSTSVSHRLHLDHARTKY